MCKFTINSDHILFQKIGITLKIGKNDFAQLTSMSTVKLGQTSPGLMYIKEAIEEFEVFGVEKYSV